MNGPSDSAAGGSPAGELAEAFYFDSGERRLFGWLHGARGEIGGVGLLVCKPFGYEAICSHRSLRSFAEAAARAGIPTLRFDYVGTGDSADLDPRADQLAAWTDDVIAAVAELQRHTGVERVCLLGFRLGGLLAVLAARRCPSVVGLALISPVFSGRRYVREMRTTRLASSMGMHPAAADHAAAAGNDGSMEVSGFSFSAATLAALGQVDLTSEAAPTSSMLIIDGSSLPVARVWAKQLTDAGVPTQYHALPGLIEMLMTAPQLASVPREMIATTCSWLSQFRAANKPDAVASATHKPGSLKSLPLAQGTGPQDFGSERPIWFGTDAALFGILSEPRQSEKRRRAVIMLNAGADFHIGASGIYVGLARHWAARGYLVLRMDFAGIGDSATRAGRPDQEVFPPGAVRDMRDAIDWLSAQFDIRDFTLCGICSGAYHALRGAAEGLPVHRILLVNPQNYFWKEGMSITGMQVSELVGNVEVYRRRMFSAATWKRLLTGQINVGYIAMVYLRRALLMLESRGREVARRLHIHLPSDLGWELEQIAARGVYVVFVFARGEPGVDLLKLQGGSSVAKLGERCRIRIIENADHVFSKAVPRAMLQTILSDELFASAKMTSALDVVVEQRG